MTDNCLHCGKPILVDTDDEPKVHRQCWNDYTATGPIDNINMNQPESPPPLFYNDNLEEL